MTKLSFLCQKTEEDSSASWLDFRISSLSFTLKQFCADLDGQFLKFCDAGYGRVCVSYETVHVHCIDAADGLESLCLSRTEPRQVVSAEVFGKFELVRGHKQSSLLRRHFWLAMIAAVHCLPTG